MTDAFLFVQAQFGKGSREISCEMEFGMEILVLEIKLV